jgi:hypothetical protein
MEGNSYVDFYHHHTVRQDIKQIKKKILDKGHGRINGILGQDKTNEAYLYFTFSFTQPSQTRKTMV